MKDGFIKVAAGTPDVQVADCEFNAAEIIKMVREMEAEGAKVMVFPELCITAYTCGDLFWQENLLEEAKVQLVRIAEETADAFLEALSIQTPAPWLVLPEGCELAKRGDQYFVLNYKAQSCEITLKKKVTDRLTGNEIEGTYEVAPYGVLVLL